MKKSGYVALVHKDHGTSYGVSFPDLPGCISAGDTMPEALAHAAEALAGHLDLMRIDGDRIPAPRSEDAIRRDAALREDLEGATLRVIEPATLPTQAA
jgi:predicted RNase H-like HicB family nuclease